MHRFAIILGAAALAACSGAEDSGGSAEQAEEVAPAPLAPDGGPFVGTFILIDADGNEFVSVMGADGRFSVENLDGGSSEGDYEVTETGFCIVIDGDEENPRCIVSGEVAEDGSWVNTNPEGEDFTIRRVSAPEDAAPPEEGGE